MNADSKPANPTKVTRAAKARLTPVEKLTEQEVQSLRLSAADQAAFEDLRTQIKVSSDDLQSFESEDVSTMDDARHDLFSAARQKAVRDNTALVHFLAPRVLKLREGEAKRKWRSFVTKLQKDTKLI